MRAKTELKRKEKEAISKIHTLMLSQISDSEKTIKEKGYPLLLFANGKQIIAIQ